MGGSCARGCGAPCRRMARSPTGATRSPACGETTSRRIDLAQVALAIEAGGARVVRPQMVGPQLRAVWIGGGRPGRLAGGGVPRCERERLARLPHVRALGDDVVEADPRARRAGDRV